MKSVQTQEVISSRPMKSFPDVIKIEVPVQSIADRLLNEINPDFKHRGILAEAIIGTAVNEGTIGYIYNALAGFTNDIDFQVGEMISCSEKDRRVNTFVAVSEVDQSSFSSSEDVEIGHCAIVEIDLYKSDKIKVQFQQHKYRSSEMETVERWVDHKKCAHYPKYEVVETRP